MDAPSRVVAAPFRAHLNHICASTALHWSVIALHAGLPLGLARALLDVRPGRRVQSIAPTLARQVLAITPESLDAARRQLVPARASRQVLRRLASLGWSSRSVASRLHVAQGMLDALATGLTTEVPQLVELQLCSLLAATEATPRARSGRLVAAA